MQIAIISVPTLANKENITNGSIASALVLKAFKKAVFMPNDATNGEVIESLFPNVGTTFSNVIDLNLWWNAKYKAKNEIHCACTDEEIAKSFIDDVKAVKNLLPMAESEDKE